MSINEFDPIAMLVVKHARDAFGDAGVVAAQWRALNFTAAPDVVKAVAQYDAFLALLNHSGTRVHLMPPGRDAELDSIYVRDASVVTPRGVVLCRMGKALRAREPEAQAAAFATWGIPVIGAIEPPGLLEGGDVAWLNDRTIAVGRGYRTNDAGIAQLRAFLDPQIELIIVPLPHWQGPTDVFHLMSVLSPVDHDLAVVYSPLIPVAFRERLLADDFRLVEVPDSEFASMGTNVLATAPRQCVMLDGNPRTRAALEQAGAEVRVYDGSEISVKGGGGPTCLTRPILRSVVYSSSSSAFEATSSKSSPGVIGSSDGSSWRPPRRPV